MEMPIDTYWKLRLIEVKQALEKNHFEAFVVDQAEAALAVVLEHIWPVVAPRSVSWGGSVSFVQTGLYHRVREMSGVTVIDTYDKKLTEDEKLERRRQALLTDLFFTGTNAITESGHLVNLDMVGNRVAALTFGPRHVVVVAGRNKIVHDLESAWDRIKSYAAPVNCMRLDKQTPCAATGYCQDCKSPDRICNTWTITEKAFPKGRVKIILVNADLGF
jgi:hypothetical protein